MEDYVVKTIIGGVISWTTLFIFLRKLVPNSSYDICNRLVASIHAILAIILFILTVQDWSCPICPLNSNSSPKQMQTMAITMGYLIYDLICSQFSNKAGLDNTFHHLVGIVGLGAGLTYQKCGSEMVAALFITEISSPFLHLREFLKEVGYKDTHFNLLAEILFVVTYFVMRMIGGTYVAYAILFAKNPLLIKAMTVGIQFVSVFWFYKIFKIFQYRLNKRTMVKKLAHE